MPVSTRSPWESRRDAVQSLVLMAVVTVCALLSMHDDRLYPVYVLVAGFLMGLGMAVASVRLDFFYAAPRIVYPAVILIFVAELSVGNYMSALGAVGGLIGVGTYDYIDNEFPQDSERQAAGADVDVDD